jgi:hypothetical protein
MHVYDIRRARRYPMVAALSSGGRPEDIRPEGKEKVLARAYFYDEEKVLAAQRYFQVR